MAAKLPRTRGTQLCRGMAGSGGVCAKATVTSECGSHASPLAPPAFAEQKDKYVKTNYFSQVLCTVLYMLTVFQLASNYTCRVDQSCCRHFVVPPKPCACALRYAAAGRCSSVRLPLGKSCFLLYAGAWFLISHLRTALRLATMSMTTTASSVASAAAARLGAALSDAQYFESSMVREVDIARQLDSSSLPEKLDAMKRVVALLSLGKDASRLFPAVVKNIVCPALGVKKLVYLYLVHYAEAQPELALLSLNTFQKDVGHPHPPIRALALRVLSAIRVPAVLPIVTSAVTTAAGDASPYVRQTAAAAVAKVYALDVDSVDELLPPLTRLLGDASMAVAAAAVAAWTEVAPRRYDFLHPHFRRLCRALPSMEPWAQGTVVAALLRYARTQLPPPHRGEREGGGVQAAGTSAVFAAARAASGSSGNGLLAEDDFYADVPSLPPPSSASGHPVAGDPTRQTDGAADMDLLLDSVQPLLASPHAGVVMAAISLLYHTAPTSLLARVAAKPLLRLLLSGSPATAAVAVQAAIAVTRVAPATLLPHVAELLPATADGSSVAALKASLLSVLAERGGGVASPPQRAALLTLLGLGLASPDPVVAVTCAGGLGKLAAAHPPSAAAAVRRLSGVVAAGASDVVVAEAVGVLRRLLQRDPSAHAGALQYLAAALLAGEYAQSPPVEEGGGATSDHVAEGGTAKRMDNSGGLDKMPASSSLLLNVGDNDDDTGGGGPGGAPASPRRRRRRKPRSETAEYEHEHDGGGDGTAEAASAARRGARRVDAPAARAAIVWLIGEFAGDLLPRLVAAETLRLLAARFSAEAPGVKLQVVNLAAKLAARPAVGAGFAAGGDGGGASGGVDDLAALADGSPTADDDKPAVAASVEAALLVQVLRLASLDADWDVRDKARMLAALLTAPLPSSASSSAGMARLRAAVAVALLAKKPACTPAGDVLGDSDGRGGRPLAPGVVLGSLFHALGSAPPPEAALPAWATAASADALRAAEVKPTAPMGMGGSGMSSAEWAAGGGVSGGRGFGGESGRRLTGISSEWMTAHGVPSGGADDQDSEEHAGGGSRGGGTGWATVANGGRDWARDARRRQAAADALLDPERFYAEEGASTGEEATDRSTGEEDSYDEEEATEELETEEEEGEVEAEAARPPPVDPGATATSAPAGGGGGGVDLDAFFGGGSAATAGPPPATAPRRRPAGPPPRDDWVTELAGARPTVSPAAALTAAPTGGATAAAGGGSSAPPQGAQVDDLLE